MHNLSLSLNNKLEKQLDQEFRNRNNGTFYLKGPKSELFLGEDRNLLSRAKD